MSLKTREWLNLCPREPTCLVPCWWILWIHRKERHHRCLRHQRAVILCCQPHCRYYWKKETWVYCRHNTARGFLVRSYGTFLLNLRRSLVGLPRRTHPWPAPQISDYWAAWKSNENNTLWKSKQKQESSFLSPLVAQPIYSPTAVSSLQLWPVLTNLNCCGHKLLLAHPDPWCVNNAQGVLRNTYMFLIHTKKAGKGT